MARQPSSAKEHFWRRMLRRWRRSGLTVRQYCDQNHLSVPSFYAWRRTIAQRDQEAASAAPAPRCLDHRGSDSQATFVPVQIVATPPTPTAAIEVVLGSGRVIRVASGFEPDMLRQLLPLLEEPSC
jgi:hypothetical protein